MKFSDIREEDWLSLQPYLDTCLLPVTGLTGTEPPWQATNRLERLRDLLDLVEGPFRGRVVTYPALQYLPATELAPEIDRLCRNLKQAGFRHCLVALPDAELLAGGEVPSCDFLLTEGTSPEAVRAAVTALWNPPATAPGPVR